jgi:hypothetical protein
VNPWIPAGFAIPDGTQEKSHTSILIAISMPPGEKIKTLEFQGLRRGCLRHKSAKSVQFFQSEPILKHSL